MLLYKEASDKTYHWENGQSAVAVKNAEVSSEK